MSVASLNPEDLSGGHVKIGAPSHLARNLGVLLALGGLGVGIWLWTARSNAQDAQRLAPFDQFRSVYADKCGVPSYAGAAPDVVKDAYLTSTNVQQAVAKQLAALSGGATCEDVQAAMKSVDFVVPKAPAPTP
jgi:hypothetical protein